MRFVPVTLFTFLPLLASAADAPLFAAPSPPAMPGTAGGALRVVASLLVVLLAVFAAAWLARRLRRLQAGSSGGIELLAQVTLGTRERAVLLKVGGERLLVGVASGGVSLLHRLDPAAMVAQADGTPSPDEPRKPDFAALLRRSLGL